MSLKIIFNYDLFNNKLDIFCGCDGVFTQISAEENPHISPNTQDKQWVCSFEKLEAFVKTIAPFNLETK
jgi:hypothetical protein